MKNLGKKLDWMSDICKELKCCVDNCKARHKKMQLNTIFLNAAIQHFADILKESHCLEYDEFQLEQDLPALKNLKKTIGIKKLEIFSE